MTEKICGIYGIFSEDGKRVYIGQSSDIEKRWSDHAYNLNNRTHHCKFLQNHFNKHGNPIFEILTECPVEDLDYLETWYWNSYKNLGFQVFNSKPEFGVLRGPSNGMFGKKHTKETKAKISERKKGGLGYWYGKTHTPVTKEKMRLAQLSRSPSSYGAIFYYILIRQNKMIKINSIGSYCKDCGLCSQGNLTNTFNHPHKHRQHKGFYPIARTNTKTQVTELYDSYFTLTHEQLKELQNV